MTIHKPVLKDLTILILVLIILVINYQKFDYSATYKKNAFDESQLILNASKMCTDMKDFVKFDEFLKGPLSQSDPRLIEIIRSKFLYAPSKLPYNVKTPKDKDESEWQTAEVIRLLDGKTNGFVIEAGAHNGELISNSLYLERNYGWDGILIEPTPHLFISIQTKNRKLWSMPACISHKPYPLEADLKITPHESYKNRISPVYGNGGHLVQCFPVFSILLALNRTSIDFFSLDIEGYEIAALKAIPWDKVKIKVIAVEVQFYNKIQQTQLVTWMGTLGYKKIVNSYAKDMLFYHPYYIKNDL